MRVLLFLVTTLAACEGPEGPAGPTGDMGPAGDEGNGAGTPGPAGDDGFSPWVVSAGVDVSITAFDIDANAATISFAIKDAAGKSLDRSGTLTQGQVNVAFVLAQLPEALDGGAGQYTAYTTNAAGQAATETSGTFGTVDVRQGTYTYTFATPLTGFDPSVTQTVLAVADRTYEGVRAFDREQMSVRPSGAAPLAREEVTEESCNGCHGTSLALHGGRYTAPSQCVMCHTPQSTDPQSGNTVDFKVMIHKIHRGKNLPSVVSGTPYQIVGFGGSVADFSTVVFPQNIGRCETCHAGAQGDRWKTTLSKAACTSCHDTTIFEGTATGNQVAHAGGTGSNINEASCATCHSPVSVIAPVDRTHYTRLLAPNAPLFELEILSMINTGPGQTPVMTFKALENGVPRNLITTPMSSVVATIAGPNTDFAGYWQARIQGTGAVGTLASVDAPNGVFSYTFPASAVIPVNATGSYSVGIEASNTPVGSTVRSAPLSPTFAFAVTDAMVMARRQIVSTTTCNGCHQELSFHGGGRKNPNYCVFCHNPNKANDQRVARFESSTVFAEPVDFRVMVHKIHMGDELSQPYVLGGFPSPSIVNPAGTPTNFAEVRYPREPTDCAACHTSKNWTLPLSASTAYLPSTGVELSCSETPGADANAYCDNPFWTITATTKIQPTASVCTSCHDSPDATAHALVNTTLMGAESCATCHGTNKEWDVERFHGMP